MKRALFLLSLVACLSLRDADAQSRAKLKGKAKGYTATLYLVTEDSSDPSEPNDLSSGEVVRLSERFRYDRRGKRIDPESYKEANKRTKCRDVKITNQQVCDMSYPFESVGCAPLK